MNPAPPIRMTKPLPRRWRLPAAAAVLPAVWLAAFSCQHAEPKGRMLTGYIASLETVEAEYVRFYGKVLTDEAVKQQFTQATALVNRGEYGGAAGLLESAGERAAVPVIFNDIGIVYAQLNDRARAVNAFREALARDSGYQPVRFNLKRLKGITVTAADPVTQEVEANNNAGLANVIPLGAAVDAAVSPSSDVDFFRVQAPPAPRDVLRIEIANDSKTLIPALSVFDADKRFVGWGKDTRAAGASLVQFLSPEPNVSVYLQIWGHTQSTGGYTLTVRPTRAFDAYEPNDDILNARRVPTGQNLEANIMDQRDTDFYSFVSPRTGQVEITVANRSTTLIPALSTFAPDKRSMGFGLDVRTPGASLKHAMPVQQGEVYFLQVWSQADSAGTYMLRIE